MQCLSATECTSENTSHFQELWTALEQISWIQTQPKREKAKEQEGVLYYYCFYVKFCTKVIIPVFLTLLSSSADAVVILIA